jgi:hypothetical protein
MSKIDAKDQNGGKGKTVSLEMRFVRSWDGNSQDFFHRDGGVPDSGTFWKDTFLSLNPALPVCGLNTPISLTETGIYWLVWEADLIFADPACRAATSDRLAMQSTVIALSSGQVSNTFHSQAYVCANREGLVFNLGIDLKFRLSETGQIDLSFFAYDDRMVGGGQTNMKEVIVKKATLYRL